MAVAPKSDHDMLTELHAAVCGVEGKNGLLEKHNKLETDHYKLRDELHQLKWVIWAIIIISGASVGGVKLFDFVARVNGG